MRVRVPPFTRIEPAHGLKPGSSTRTSWVPADTSGIESGARPTASPSRNTCAPRFDSTSITPASFVVAAVAGRAAARLGTRVRVVDGGGAGTAGAFELVCGAGAGTLASRGSSVSGAERGNAGGLPGAAITSVGAGAGAEAMTRYANPYPAANPPISPARTATVPTSRTRTFSAGGPRRLRRSTARRMSQVYAEGRFPLGRRCDGCLRCESQKRIRRRIEQL
jgi:hypothetical protein